MLILASKSPRRQEILEMFNMKFETIVSNFDEHSISCDDIRKLPELEAIGKAKVIAKDHPKDTILAADTGVFINNIMLGKPIDKEDARRMLKLLSNNTHDVITGVCIIKDNKEYTFSEVSKVTFKDLSEEEIENYLNLKEPYDKAGAYAVQGFGANLIKRIDGDYFNIMGLPIAAVINKLKELE